MIDIKLIRENPEIIKNDLKKRGDKEALKRLDELIKLDKDYRTFIQEVETLRKKRNDATQKVSELKKQKKSADKELKEAQKISSDIKEKEEKMKGLENATQMILRKFPNIMHESVPIGKDDSENITIREFGKKEKHDFELKDHETLGVALGGIDIERAAKISGSRFYFLKGDIALLERAIMQYGIDFMLKKGYTLVLPPFMLRREPFEGVTAATDFEDSIYKIENEDLYLIATSEHTLTAQYMNETLLMKDLPIKMIGFSPCFRREAGAHGKDTKGIFRVHQFNKIEQIVFCKPEDSWKLHEEIIKNAEEFFKSLEIPFRTVNICTGDLGVVASKKYDIEAWMPYQKTYREMVSASNCTEWQARRLGIKFREDEGKAPLGFVHTLNSTVVTDRALVAIIENFQQKDGSILIPKVLQSYMGGKTKVSPQK